MSDAPTGRVAGKVALVTGSGQGLGRAIAEELAAEGASVVVADIDAGAAEAVAESLRSAGARSLALEVDVADAASVAAMAGAAIAAFGRMDVVCNNAGILDDFKPLADTSVALWDRVLDVNLKGCFLVSRAFAPGMVRQGSGVFVNIASMAGVVAGAGGTAYTASKHGVIGLTRQITLDYGPLGLRANAICPGSMDTEMSRDFLATAPEVLEIVNSVPAGRQGRPDEVAKLAVYLASDDAAFMHGAAVVLDGGWTVR